MTSFFGAAGSAAPLISRPGMKGNAEQSLCSDDHGLWAPGVVLYDRRDLRSARRGGMSAVVPSAIKKQVPPRLSGHQMPWLLPSGSTVVDYPELPIQVCTLGLEGFMVASHLVNSILFSERLASE